MLNARRNAATRHTLPPIRCQQRVGRVTAIGILTLDMNNQWIGVVSRSHVQLGVKGGFMQLNHGKKAPLQRLEAGDLLAMYSPRTDYPDGAALQAFTALGRVVSGEVYQVVMAPDFEPYRVDVQFMKCRETPIKPLIEALSFIKSKTHWGAAFRFGWLKVPADDFALIAEAMGVALPVERHTRAP
jgi:EVE domain